MAQAHPVDQFISTFTYKPFEQYLKPFYKNYAKIVKLANNKKTNWKTKSNEELLKFFNDEIRHFNDEPVVIHYPQISKVEQELRRLFMYMHYEKDKLNKYFLHTTQIFKNHV